MTDILFGKTPKSKRKRSTSTKPTATPTPTQEQTVASLNIEKPSPIAINPADLGIKDIDYAAVAAQLDATHGAIDEISNPIYNNILSITNQKFYRTDYYGNFNTDFKDEYINNSGNAAAKQKVSAEDTFNINNTLDGKLQFEIPRWGVPDYINERSAWQKQSYSLTGDEGFFYFKLFFKFNTNYGLFGGIMETDSGVFGNSNTAARYLYMIRKYYKTEKIRDRILALYKFTSLLSEINTTSPWFFKSINNLNAVYSTYTNDFTAQKYIDIGCSEEAVDMRLNTLMDLYTYACYDNINCKEIIPENLRKFDMSVLIMNIPIKYYQTGITSRSKTFNAKTAAGESRPGDNSLSFQMFTFSNCEFAVSSFGNYYNNINNETAFPLGKHSIRINFDRCYKHTFNEWNEILFGSDGVWYNESMPDVIIGDASDAKYYKVNALGSSRKQLKRLELISKAFAKDSVKSNQIEEFTEQCITNALAGQTFADSDDFYATAGNLYGNLGPGTEYFENKMRVLHKPAVKGNIYYVANQLSHVPKYLVRSRYYRPVTVNAYAQQLVNINNYDLATGEYYGPSGTLY